MKAPKPWRVHKVVFTGNSLLKRYELLNLIEMKPFLLRKNPRFSSGKLKADLASISQYYQNRGFLGVSVKVSSIKRDSVKKRVSVEVQIVEGEQTFVDEVVYSGWRPDSSMIKKLKCKEGEVFDQADIIHDESYIKRMLRGEGYLDVKIITRSHKGQMPYRVNLDIHIISGSRIVVDSVLLSGITKLKTEVITRELDFDHGDTLTSKLIHKTERKLYRTGLLNSVNISYVSDDDTVYKVEDSESTKHSPVSVLCKEAKFYRLKLGAGYGSEEKIRGALETSYSNLFRLGHRLALKGKVSQLMQIAQIVYSTPWFLGIPLRFDGKVYYNKYSDENPFEGEFRGVTLSFEKLLTDKVTLHLLTELEDVLWLRSEGLPEDLPQKNTQTFGVDLIYDTRDDLMDPEDGLFVSSEIEMAGLVLRNTNRFIRINEDIRWYHKVNRISFAAGIKVGWVRPYANDTEVPLQNQFYAGGSKSVRGFKDNYLRTEIVDDSILHPRSGLTMITANCIEIRFPIIGYLKGACFIDAGYLEDGIGTVSLQSVFKNIRWSAGPGLRLKTPLAVLRTDLGFKLHPRNGEDIYHLHFDIGQAF